MGTLGPTNQLNGTYVDITGKLVPFAFDVTISRNSSSGAANPPDVVVPLFGPAVAPEIVEGVNWFPTTPGSPVAPVLSQEDPSGGIWSAAGANWFLTLAGSPLGEFRGGVLKLFGSGVNVTLITFGDYYGAPQYHQVVTIEYADSTPPVAPDAEEVELPFSDSVSIASNSGKWYTFTLESTADMDLNTIGSDFDTLIALFDDAGAFIVSDDDGGGSSTSQIIRTLAAGQYYVFVCGYQADFDDDWGVSFPGTSLAGTANVSLTETP